VLTIGDPLQDELGEQECLRLLGTTALGRLGYTRSALPAVQPVTYRLVDGSVLIPAVAGGPSAGAVRNGIVVLGVDSFGSHSTGSDPSATGEFDGWAVSVIGPARLVNISGGRPAGSGNWPSGSFLVLEPVLVSGWRRAAGAFPR
jgi:hypothetical protein